MEQKDFTTSILVTHSPIQVFDAINNPAAWWSGEIQGSATQVGDVFIYRYKDLHMSAQKVTELIPGEKVEWLVTESALNFVDHKEEWTGTKIVFEIQKEGDKTALRFTHQGLTPQVECYNNCSVAWTTLLQTGLFALITKGSAPDIVLA